MNDLQKAATLLERGDIRQAEALYRRILKAEPANASAYLGLGRIAMRTLHFRSAVKLFEKSSTLASNHPQPLLNMGDAYSAQRQFSRAGECYARAAAVGPDDAQAQYAYGLHLAEAGDAARAAENLRSALRLDPTHAYAAHALSRLKTFCSRDDDDIVALQTTLKREGLPHGHQMAAHYALGKAYDDIGDIERAFAHMTKANALQRQLCSFSVADMKPFFEKIKATFDSDTLSRRNSRQEPPFTPIFIVGLPRSGSTLLEQMLGSHSEIAAAGELPFVGREVAAALANQTRLALSRSLRFVEV